MALPHLLILIRGVLARAWRALRNGDCPCEFCEAHRAFVAQSPPLAESAPRYACVSCGQLVCLSWPEACPTCLVAGNVYEPHDWPPRGAAYLETLEEARRRRGL